MKRRSPRTTTSLAARIASRLDEAAWEDLQAQAADTELHELLTRQLDIAVILTDLL